MPQHQQFDVFGREGPSEEHQRPTESNEDQVQQSLRHASRSCLWPQSAGSPQLSGLVQSPGTQDVGRVGPRGCYPAQPRTVNFMAGAEGSAVGNIADSMRDGSANIGGKVHSNV